MSGIFDTHSHYSDSKFSEYPGGADALLSEIFSSGVDRIINVAVDTVNSCDVIAQAAKYPGMYAAVGIHPTEAYHETDGICAAMDRLRKLIEKRSENKIVAIGEIGLDYHYEDTDKPVQQRYFEAQLELALKEDMPVIIHDRDAHGDCFETVIKYPGIKGVFHSYSGSPEMAKELVRRGFYISFSGVISFKNAPRVKQAAAAVPLDRLLLETDAPYLAPEPYRGRLNRSDYIRMTAAALGSVFSLDADEMISVCSENAKKLFSVT